MRYVLVSSRGVYGYANIRLCVHTAAGSGEHVIRDLNDEINKRMREKRHWEKRIVELGGPDYARTQPQAYDADGSAVHGAGGYKYFGAAKNLPGVRELFQKEVRAPKKRSRYMRACLAICWLALVRQALTRYCALHDRLNRQDMFKNIEPDYFGFRETDDDEALLREEQDVEKKLQQAAMDEWDRAEAQRNAEIASLVRTICLRTICERVT